MSHLQYLQTPFAHTTKEAAESYTRRSYPQAPPPMNIVRAGKQIQDAMTALKPHAHPSTEEQVRAAIYAARLYLDAAERLVTK